VGDSRGGPPGPPGAPGAPGAPGGHWMVKKNKIVDPLVDFRWHFFWWVIDIQNAWCSMMTAFKKMKMN